MEVNKSTTIWKTQLTVGRQEIEMPEGAMIMAAREQFNHLCLWYRCDPAKAKTKRVIEVFMTGKEIAPVPITEMQQYIDTVLLDGGAFVVHVFEVMPSGLMVLDMAANHFPVEGNA